MKLFRLLLLCSALLVLMPGAGRCGELEELYLYPFIQYFTWEEYFTGKDSVTRQVVARTLKEDGSLFGAGVAAKYSFLNRALTLKGKLELFGGRVYYDGYSYSVDQVTAEVLTTPAKTDVYYFGIKPEADMGWRFAVENGSLEPFSGVGYRWWSRGLMDTVDATGTRVSGNTEYWQSFYVRLGLRGDYQVYPWLRVFAEGGAKYPFLNRNDAAGITVKPGDAWSAFAEAGLHLDSYRVSFSYEGFRFARSPGVPTGPNSAIYQPESASDIFGLNVGMVFH